MKDLQIVWIVLVWYSQSMCALLHVTMTSSRSRYATSSSTQTAIPLQILLCIWQRSWPVMVWEEFYQIHLHIWPASPFTRSWCSSSASHWAWNRWLFPLKWRTVDGRCFEQYNKDRRLSFWQVFPPRTRSPMLTF